MIQSQLYILARAPVVLTPQFPNEREHSNMELRYGGIDCSARFIEFTLALYRDEIAGVVIQVHSILKGIQAEISYAIYIFGCIVD